MAKSKDAFRTISEVADWLETPAHVLRFWESKFTQVRPVKRAGGRRYYRPDDMALLGGIKALLHNEGMTIKGVQKLLRERGVAHVAALAPPHPGDDDMVDVQAPRPDLRLVHDETAEEAPAPEAEIDDAELVPEIEAELPPEPGPVAEEEPPADEPPEEPAFQHRADPLPEEPPVAEAPPPEPLPDPAPEPPPPAPPEAEPEPQPVEPPPALAPVTPLPRRQEHVLGRLARLTAAQLGPHRGALGSLAERLATHREALAHGG
ncbi:MerR family transcriptional regulator [Pseudoroseicyclus tamaricis]|uniref:MerR family transcriptional regulator n=1 Tax=Pseudoroseicyclus tamaricis TaxID=2705421 RepID=A0A6B2JJE2_9RHOB|nr:MerR family transcriptional regulator [Pseudoroseicyclus tamaricis]NDV01553.1 MerR family transcriptional regulator [Pseudoroseicyclus tamaricis]